MAQFSAAVELGNQAKKLSPSSPSALPPKSAMHRLMRRSCSTAIRCHSVGPTRLLSVIWSCMSVNRQTTASGRRLVVIGVIGFVSNNNADKRAVGSWSLTDLFERLQEFGSE